MMSPNIQYQYPNYMGPNMVGPNYMGPNMVPRPPGGPPGNMRFPTMNEPPGNMRFPTMNGPPRGMEPRQGFQSIPPSGPMMRQQTTLMIGPGGMRPGMHPSMMGPGGPMGMTPGEDEKGKRDEEEGGPIMGKMNYPLSLQLMIFRHSQNIISSLLYYV